VNDKDRVPQKDKQRVEGYNGFALLICHSTWTANSRKTVKTRWTVTSCYPKTSSQELSSGAHSTGEDISCIETSTVDLYRIKIYQMDSSCLGCWFVNTPFQPQRQFSLKEYKNNSVHKLSLCGFFFCFLFTRVSHISPHVLVFLSNG